MERGCVNLLWPLNVNKLNNKACAGVLVLHPLSRVKNSADRKKTDAQINPLFYTSFLKEQIKFPLLQITNVTIKVRIFCMGC